jgi:hypothetical protein
MVYLAYDGDGCGKKVGRAIMANDESALHEWSAKIDLGHEIVNHWVAENGGKRISGGGDEGSFKLPGEVAHHIEQLRKDYYYATKITISVGIGRTLSEAGRALLAAKFRGKDQVAWYDEGVEKDIASARKKVKKGKASQEEYKLAEAYLEKNEGDPMNHDNCPYCAQTDGVDPDHCKYCHDAQPDAGHDDCPYCAQSDAAAADPHADCPYCQKSDQSGPAGSDCPYCKDGHQQEQVPAIQSPDSQNSQAAPGSPEEAAQYAAMDMNPPGIPKPQVGDGGSPSGIGQANPADMSGAPAAATAGDGLMPEGAHSKEDLQTIAQQMESQTIDGKPDEKQQADMIDDTQVIGNDMEGNVSRPGGYENNTPGDMGLDEQHATEENDPNLSDVLKQGLDSQSNDIEKDRVRDMVGQALAGFKASKMILERAREQAPDFYQSSIAMLAAMIKMAEMLGLSGNANAADPLAGAGAQPGPNDSQAEWQEPFPKHPDHGGERKPGHAPSKEEGAGDPKGQSPVGQPIGKLPSKATTHVARTPMPPGAVNAKGQQKVIDPKTGKVRFIDRKQGMVQSTTGVPVKAPGRGDDESKN